MGILQRARTTPHLFTAMELDRLPTLSTSQADDLRLENYADFGHNGRIFNGVRVWLSRCDVGMITVEYLRGGRWRTHVRYAGGYAGGLS